jgi:hypothetical protein
MSIAGYRRLTFYKSTSDDEWGPGWISPSGDFWPCDSCEHDNCADFIFRTVFSSPLDPDLPRGGATNRLEDKGWVRLVSDGMPLMSDLCRPTERQMEMLMIFSTLAGMTEGFSCFHEMLQHWIDWELKEGVKVDE